MEAANAVDPASNLISVLAVTQVKPIHSKLIETLRAHPEVALLIAEEGVVRGGVGQSLAATLGPRKCIVDFAGYPDEFVPHGETSRLEDQVGLSAGALTKRLTRLVDEKAH